MKSSYFWSVDEERQLGKLWREGVTDPEILAVRLKRKPEAIRKKLKRLGLVVGRDRTAGTTTNGVRITDEREALDIPEELPTIAGFELNVTAYIIECTREEKPCLRVKPF